MTSKERILNTVYRKPVDRVPISMYELSPYEGSAYASFANNEPSYQPLLAYMRENTDTIMQCEANISYPYIDNAIEVKSRREGESTVYDYTLHTPKGDLTAKSLVKDNIYTVWNLEHFLKEPSDIEKYMSLDFTCKVNNSNLREMRDKLGENGIICPSIRDPICRGAELFSMEDFLVFAITETEEAKKFLDFQWELCQTELKGILAGDVKDIMVRVVGPEYATPPYLPDVYFEDFVTKYLKIMAPMINEAGAISRVHSHGKVRHALEEFAKTDVMCVDPVEPLPDGNIALGEMKQLYGDKFVLLGNIELKELEVASEERIEEIVKETLKEGKKGGGFILMPTATPINVPLAPVVERNMFKMIEAGLKYGAY
ncbi:MAG: uroporphyrinogen decarboxylase family protein [Acutalibacteraceae bacterium]